MFTAAASRVAKGRTKENDLYPHLLKLYAAAAATLTASLPPRG